MRRPLATILLVSLASTLGVIAVAAIGQQVPPGAALPEATATQPATEPATRPATEPATQPVTQPVGEAAPPAHSVSGAALLDEQGKTVEGVRLTSADLRAVVRGPLAQVTLALTFFNDRGNILGGELMFPLPEGATVTGYGLDVNGRMVDGVAVDKQEARDIYQTESTRRVDPGFVEHVGGTGFRTRLYPVPAHGFRSARVQYVTEVAAGGTGATLSLPMGWGEVEKWTATIEAPEAVIEPAVPFGAGIAFYGSPHRFAAAAVGKAAPREVVVRFAVPPGRSVAIEQWPRDAATLESVVDPAIEGPADRPRQRSPARGGPARGGHRDSPDKPARQANVLAAAGEQIVRFEDYESYFLLNDTPPGPPPGAAPETAADLKAKPVRRVAILWDAGLSHAPSNKPRQAQDGALRPARDRALRQAQDRALRQAQDRALRQAQDRALRQAQDRDELKLLDSLLLSWGGATGDLVVFRNTVEAPTCFDLGTPDGRDKVIAQIASLTYDGASDLGHLPLPRNVSGFVGSDRAGASNAARPAGNYDCLLLFTDGAGGFDPRMMPRAQVPVYAFNDEPSAETTGTSHSLLQHICQESGGRYFNLGNFSGDGTREPWSLLSVDFNPAEVAEVYPAGPVAVEGMGHLTLTGRLLAPTATVKLNYGYGGHVMQRQAFTLKIADAGNGTLIPQYWGQQKVAELSLEPDVNAGEIRKIGKHFNLVTPNTSLLVLETVDQYVRYNVVPPKNQTELYEQFLARTAQYKAPAGQGQPKFLPAAWAWDRQVRWWEDPRAFRAPPAAPAGNRQWNPLDEDARDSRSDERRKTEQHADAVRQSRDLLREALQARRAGDAVAARDLYTGVIVMDPGNALALEGLNELRDGLGGNASPRERLAAQAARRAGESASAFRAALNQASQDINHDDLEAADSDIDEARAALDSSITAYGTKERLEFEARLTDAKQRVDAARLSAARNARATREKVAADVHAQHDKDRTRGGVNLGPGYHRNDYGWGSGGGSTSLFGGSGGGSSGLFGGSGAGGDDSATHPPPPRSTHSTGSTGSPQAGTPPAASAQPPPSEPAPPLPASIESPSASMDRVTLSANVVHSWGPDPYMTAIKRVPAKKAYDAYLEQRAAYGSNPEFYLDCGDYLERVGQHAMALRVVTNVAAFHLTDTNLLRRAAYRLAELGDRDRAIDLFERVLQLTPLDLPAYRDLALALSDRADARAEQHPGHGRPDGDSIAADYGRSLELLDQVIEQPAPPEQIAMLCLMDANRVIARARRLEDAGEIPPVVVPLDPQIIRNLDCDLRVVMTCDTDEADASLTVLEPDGGAASASPASNSGGTYATPAGGKIDGISKAHGPAEYCVRNVSPGAYRVQVNLLAGHGSDRSGPCTVRLSVFTDFGRAGEQRKSLSVRVTDAHAAVEVGIVASRGPGSAERRAALAALRALG